MPLSKVNPANYQQQLTAKAERITQQFSEFSPPTLSVYDSPELHFRVRAEFKIWHQDDDSYYVMFNKAEPKQPVRIDHFPIGSTIITRLMDQLMTAIKASPLLRHKLFQIEFLTTLSGEALVSMIYHKRLGEDWQQLAEDLQQQYQIKIIGRSKKQRMVLSEDYVIETLTVKGQQYNFQQVENSFTQPNATVNQKMLTWALDHSQGLGGDLVELYCGNGNFTLVLAQNFNKVLATEISKTSVKSANYNFELNQVSNVTVARMSSEDFSSALAGEREFRRLKDIDLGSYQFSTVLVDPPRAGLDTLTEKLISQFENILYISCNPDTLYNNLKQLCQSHQITQFAIFDQFPYTDHIECGVMLTKKQQGEENE
ncbi:tRNA (uridine(54)-C5)-methyltransferase TrmA [Oceanicoccus sagamiensis]|uniref:tRNA/tmRNA (uracil-C(5))-methyltransferase n=1 Tax=Oceanicoccus sagamiensis TaxID=716816 RepID=A0A1X9NBW4_9GAMM|nr:tRNA (uridine(54)-C5)-methyltransferase TrmA [Oceanicoccus sagamiensis]ARN75520.1 tRNA (uridine(54)-C5)-methyltransferase TrmA [Oceanicoccus sagamiensis]